MGGVEVSDSVSAIVATFLRCREVLRRIKARAVFGKARKKSEDELRLAKALARAPVEIEHEYSRGVRALGPPFAIGDGYTQTLLQTTLAKLNTGLVDIISAFLVAKDPTKLRLDYNGLAALSDASCRETRESLLQLGERISRLALEQQPRAQCARCGASGCHECARHLTKGRSSQPAKAANVQPPARTPTPKEYVAGVRHANQVHWAMVRPKRRAESGSSTGSGSSSSNVSSASKVSSSSTATSLSTHGVGASPPINTTPPANRNGGQLHPQKKQSAAKLQTQPAGRPQTPQQPTKQPRKAKQNRPPPQQEQSIPLPLKEEHLSQIPDMWRPSSAPQNHQTREQGSRQDQPHQQEAIPRRRQDKSTDSYYSFTSDSTKLGEIPMHKWQTPYDYDEMERLNNAAGGWAGVWGSDGGVNTAPPAGLTKPLKKQSRGLLGRIFKITPMDPIAEG